MQYMDAHSVFVYNIYYWPSLLFLFLPLGWRFPGKETGAMLACRQKFTGYSSIYIYSKSDTKKNLKLTLTGISGLYLIQSILQDLFLAQISKGPVEKSNIIIKSCNINK